MDYFERARFYALERSRIDPPEPRDREDQLLWEWADLEYESMREDEVINA